MEKLNREQALALLKKYNKEAFHLRHALTVEGVMKHYAATHGYEEDAEFWGIVGLLHSCLGARQEIASLGVINLSQQLTSAHGLALAHQHTAYHTHVDEADCRSLALLNDAHIR